MSNAVRKFLCTSKLVCHTWPPRKEKKRGEGAVCSPPRKKREERRQCVHHLEKKRGGGGGQCVRPAFLPSYNQAPRCWLAASWSRKLSHTAGIFFVFFFGHGRICLCFSNMARLNLQIIAQQDKENKHLLIYRTFSGFILPGTLKTLETLELLLCWYTVEKQDKVLQGYSGLWDAFIGIKKNAGHYNKTWGLFWISFFWVLLVM